MDFGKNPSQNNIFVFGETLFTEGIAHLLSNQKEFNLIGQSSLIEVAQEIIQTKHTDIIIVDSTDQNKEACVHTLMFKFPHLSFICTNLNNHTIQIVSSCLIQPKTSAILTAIQLISLKKWSTFN